MPTWSVAPLLLLVSLTAHAGPPGAIARAGEAPDDGGGVHVIVGEGAESSECGFWAPRLNSAHVDLGLSALDAGPAVRQIPTFDAEAKVCEADGTCAVATSGTVTLDRADARGVAGAYRLVVGGQVVEGAFDAPWCAEPEPVVSHRRSVPVGAPWTEHHAVSWTGRVDLAAAQVVLRPADGGPGVPLDLTPSSRAAVQRLVEKDPTAEVVVRGQLRDRALRVSSVHLPGQGQPPPM